MENPSNYSSGPWIIPLLIQWSWNILIIIFQSPGTSLYIHSGSGTSFYLFFRVLEPTFSIFSLVFAARSLEIIRHSI